tara:strand:- start:241 stop:600 length:360 start_codon:yes stop_codon:yes gene_type:complete
MHVQGIGPVSVNREYGLSIEMRAPMDVTEWLEKQEPTNESAASGNSVYYISATLHNDETQENSMWMLIRGVNFNHQDGLALGLDPNSPQSKTLIDFAHQCAMVTPAEATSLDKPAEENE